MNTSLRHPLHHLSLAKSNDQNPEYIMCVFVHILYINQVNIGYVISAKFGYNLEIFWNKATYDNYYFTKNNIKHHDLYFQDGTIPSK